MNHTRNGAKGGAPKGNWNRLKHGFYSKRLRSMDMEAARALGLELDEELALLRSLLQNYVALAAETDDPELLGKAVDLSGRTIIRIGLLVRMQAALNGRAMDDGFQAMVERVIVEMGESQ